MPKFDPNNPLGHTTEGQRKALHSLYRMAGPPPWFFKAKYKDAYANYSWRCGSAVINYTGEDSKILAEIQLEQQALMESGKACFKFEWLDDRHFQTVLKCGPYPEEAGRWSRWDYFGKYDNILRFPKSSSSLAFWQMAAFTFNLGLVSVVTDQLPRFLDHFLRRN